MTEELYQEMYGELALLKAKIEALFCIAEKNVSREEIDHEIESALHFGMMTQTSKVMNDRRSIESQVDREKLKKISNLKQHLSFIESKIDNYKCESAYFWHQER